MADVISGKGMTGKERLAQTPSADVGAATVRLRLVEEKAGNLNRKIELLETNFVEFSRKMKGDVRIIEGEMLELKRTIDAMQQQGSMIVNELKLMAGKHELQTLQRYIDLWNPSRFVTRDEVDRIINERVGKRAIKSDL
jgi:predicted  nucleic acid-binding Zn-ribbon protein